MPDEHEFLREARLTVLEELVCRVYAIVLANDHDPQRTLVQFSEGLKGQLCGSEGRGESSDHTSSLTHAIEHAVSLIQTLVAAGQPIPGREHDDEVRS